MNIPFEEFKEACKHPEPGIDTRLVCTMYADDMELLCNEANCQFMIKDKKRCRQERKSKYIMRYECWNCGTEFCGLVKKGEPAEGHGGRCSYCGMPDQLDKVHTVVGVTKVENGK